MLEPLLLTVSVTLVVWPGAKITWLESTERWILGSAETVITSGERPVNKSKSVKAKARTGRLDIERPAGTSS